MRWVPSNTLSLWHLLIKVLYSNKNVLENTFLILAPLFPDFSVQTFHYSDSFFGYCHTLILTFSKKNMKIFWKYVTNQDWNFCLLLFLEINCRLLHHAWNITFLSLLFWLVLICILKETKLVRTIAKQIKTN